MCQLQIEIALIQVDFVSLSVILGRIRIVFLCRIKLFSSRWYKLLILAFFLGIGEWKEGKKRKKI